MNRAILAIEHGTRLAEATGAHLNRRLVGGIEAIRQYAVRGEMTPTDGPRSGPLAAPPCGSPPRLPRHYADAESSPKPLERHD